jgi:hypothetical protein
LATGANVRISRVLISVVGTPYVPTTQGGAQGTPEVTRTPVSGTGSREQLRAGLGSCGCQRHLDLGSQTIDIDVP